MRLDLKFGRPVALAAVVLCIMLGSGAPALAQSGSADQTTSTTLGCPPAEQETIGGQTQCVHTDQVTVLPQTTTTTPKPLTRPAPTVPPTVVTVATSRSPVPDQPPAPVGQNDSPQKVLVSPVSNSRGHNYLPLWIAAITLAVIGIVTWLRRSAK